MGCINGKQLLNEEDLNYIARNTAMDKGAVEVRNVITMTESEESHIFYHPETISKLPQETSWRSNITEVISRHDEGVLPRHRHRETREAHLQNVWHQQGEILQWLSVCLINIISGRAHRFPRVHDSTLHNVQRNSTGKSQTDIQSLWHQQWRVHQSEGVAKDSEGFISSYKWRKCRCSKPRAVGTVRLIHIH